MEEGIQMRERERERKWGSNLREYKMERESDNATKGERQHNGGRTVTQQR